MFSSLATALWSLKKKKEGEHRGPAHGDIFRIFPSGSSHVRGQQCTVAIGENRFSHR